MINSTNLKYAFIHSSKGVKNLKKTGTSLFIIALFIASLNLRPAINSIGPLINSLRDDLGMSAFMVSLLTSIPVFCMGVFSPLAVKLGARYGVERIIGYALILIGFGTMLRLFSNTSIFLIITAFFAGIGIAAMGPLLSGFIKRYFPEKVPTMISIYTFALSIGAALGSAFSIPLQNALNSWKTSLAVWALLALLAIPVWWMFVIFRIRNSSIEIKPTQSDKLPWTSQKAWLITLSFGLMSMLFYSITTWLPPIVKNLGYSEVYAGNVLTIFAMVQIPVSLFVPIILKKYPSRLQWLLTASLLELIGFLMLIFSFQPWIAAIFLGIGAGTLFTINLLLPIEASKNSQDAVSWSAMTQSVGYVIGSIGPMLLGKVYDISGSFVFSVIGMMIIVLIMMCIQYIGVAERKPVWRVKSEG